MKKINILGFGVMGKQIAALFYLGGFEVNIWSHTPMDENELRKYIKLVGRSIDKAGEGKINYLNDLNKLDNSITIEAVVESIDIKKGLYKNVREINNSPYFTNTSSFSPQEIGEGVSLLHFFNPITIGLVETCYSSVQVEEKSTSVVKHLQEIGFSLVPVKGNRGSVANYLIFREISSVLKLIEKNGYSIDAVEKIYSKVYAGRDILTIIDLVGIDVTNKIIINLKEQDSTVYLPECLNIALERKIFGKKNNTSIKQVLS